MGKKKKQPKWVDENGQPYKADSKEFGEQLWELLNDYDRMGNRCTSSVRALMEMVKDSPQGTVTETAKGPLGFLDRGGDVLSVAHIDAVGHLTHFGHVNIEGNEPWVFSPWLDDRLGLFVILDVLPMLGLKYDVLLCTNEEKGDSTGYYFEPPQDKHYRFICEFDRMGEDVVNYQYRQPDLEQALVDAGFSRPARGSYTDIVELEHVGVGAFNIAVGYEQPHTKWCRADLRILHRQLVRYCRFAEATEGIVFPFDAKKGYNHYRHRGGQSSTSSPGKPITTPGVKYYPTTPTALPLGANVSIGRNGNPPPFEFYKDDIVLDGDNKTWSVQHIGGYDVQAGCWRIAVLRKEEGGALYQTTRLETELFLYLPEIRPGQGTFLRISEWIYTGRKLGWRMEMVRRMRNVLSITLNGKEFPVGGWRSRLTRLLWESHGDHFEWQVKEARRAYETSQTYSAKEGAPKLVIHSDDYGTHRPMVPFHYNDLVLVDGVVEGIVACLYSVYMSDGTQYFWVDQTTPAADGTSLLLVEDHRLTRTAKNTNRFGLYRPGDAIRPIASPQETTNGPADSLPSAAS